MEKRCLVLTRSVLNRGLDVVNRYGTCNASPETVGVVIEMITSDVDHFWEALDMYLDRGSKGVRGFTKNRIQNAENLASLVRYYSEYYASTKEVHSALLGMKDECCATESKLGRPCCARLNAWLICNFISVSHFNWNLDLH